MSFFSCAHLFSKHLLNSYYVTGPVVCTGYNSEQNRHGLCPHKAYLESSRGHRY